MPTQILEGPRSDPRLKALTDPFTPPPLTKVRPQPLAARPEPVVEPRRHRGRLAAVLIVLAVAGAATGGALAWWEVSASGPALPTARTALASVRGSGDYTSLPFTDTASVDMTVQLPSNDDDGFICTILDICDVGGDDFTTQTYSATGSVASSIAMTAVQRSDITVQRRSVWVTVPSAVLADAIVDPASVEADDDEGEELLADGSVDRQDVADEATSIIEREARDAGVLRDAQRDVRQLLVERLHRAGFRHVRVTFV